MTQPHSRKKKQEQPPAPPALLRRRVVLRIGAVAFGVLAVLILLSQTTGIDPWPLGDENNSTSHSITDADARLAPFYTPEVRHWQPQILQWARDYKVNPNVIAIVIQIESCGDPAVLSGAGATGLMQVMPFHFEDGENMLNPDMNVKRGMGVFYECLTQFARWDLGLALACYNGGPSVTQSSPDTWAAETQYYYHWATGLWSDVLKGNKKSSTLSEWLAAGGEGLCQKSAASLQALSN